MLGWRAVDTDDEIVTIAGKPIDAIFRDHGESRFRELERECLARVCRAERQVIATGGGMVTDSENRRRMEMSGAVICLEARPDTILQRLTEEGAAEKGPVVRPMLADPDPLRRIRDLKSQRQPDYSLAHWTVHTDSMTPSETATEVVRASGLLNPQGATSTPGASDLAATVRTSSGNTRSGWDGVRCPSWVSGSVVFFPPPPRTSSLTKGHSATRGGPRPHSRQTAYPPISSYCRQASAASP